MSQQASPTIEEVHERPVSTAKAILKEFWIKEDWWAVWLGLGIITTAALLFLNGSSISWIAVSPTKWSMLSQLAEQLSANAFRYAVQLGFFGALFTLATSSIGYKPAKFISSFFSFTYFPSASLRWAIGINPKSIISNLLWLRWQWACSFPT